MFRQAAAVLALLLVAAAVRGEEERPRIFLEKRIFAETSEGRKTFYESHTVSKGETLWKILKGKSPLFPADYPSLLREFRRANPGVSDPDRLVPGQKILVPAGTGMKTARLVESGKTAAHRIRRGDTLTGILASRGVARRDFPRYLEAVKEINDSVRDVNVIIAGRSILIPTEEYFGKAPEAVAKAEPEDRAPEVVAKAEPEDRAPEAVAEAEPEDRAPEAAAPAPPGAEEPSVPEVPRAASDPYAESGPAARETPPGKPESQVAVPVSPPAEAPAVMTGREALEPESPPLPRPKPPYRGLLADLSRGLGETWVDRGMLYLPIPTGGEVVLNLEEYPVVRFGGGAQALIDFPGTLPPEVRRLISETWKNYVVVPMGGAKGPEEMIERLLAASGYHSVKEGIARPPVIGETVSVSLPARWVVLRTGQSLLRGEIILVKKTPEKPGRDLSAALRYAESVGIRVLPFSYDPSVNEGFLVGLDPAGSPPETTSGKSLPKEGLEALDFSLDYLGIPQSGNRRIRIGGGSQSFQLTVQPERIFEAGGKRHVVDTGGLSPALRTILQNSGYRVFSIGKSEDGGSIFRKVLQAAQIPFEERKGHLLSGGKEAGFEVRATGTFLTSPEWLASRKVREAVFVRGRVHSATRDLMREIGVEIVEW